MYNIEPHQPDGQNYTQKTKAVIKTLFVLLGRGKDIAPIIDKWRLSDSDEQTYNQLRLVLLDEMDALKQRLSQSA